MPCMWKQSAKTADRVNRANFNHIRNSLIEKWHDYLTVTAIDESLTKMHSVQDVEQSEMDKEISLGTALVEFPENIAREYE